MAKYWNDTKETLAAKCHELDDELAKVIAVAHKHGWNGVENSKILSVFLDHALSATVSLHLGSDRSRDAECIRLSDAVHECWLILERLDAGEREMVIAVIRGRNAPSLAVERALPL